MNEVQAGCGHIINKLLCDPTGCDECHMDFLEESKCGIREFGIEMTRYGYLLIGQGTKTFKLLWGGEIPEEGLTTCHITYAGASSTVLDEGVKALPSGFNIAGRSVHPL